jgi:inorganic pyrophosphatase
MENLPLVEVTIETPRGSFIKRTSSGAVDYVSPIPCPFNYGSIATRIGLDGDYLDAAVLGRRRRVGTRLTVQALGAVRMLDRGMMDDKLICSAQPIGAFKRVLILLFFRFFATCKGLINICRGRSGRNRCLGWIDATVALEEAGTRSDRPGPPSVADLQ